MVSYEIMGKKHIITLGGPPGSGKSTIKSILAEKLDYKMFSTGEFMRNLGTERGLTLEEFNEEIAHNKDIDLLIDAELERIEKEEDYYIVDSHLAFHFMPSAFSVFLNTPLDTAARRILNDRDAELRKKSGDTMQTFEEAKARTEKRIQNHKDRYKRHYGIDPYVASQYNLTIETEGVTPEKIATDILQAYNEWLTT